MAKCRLVLDDVDGTVRADNLEDKNWQTGSKIVYDDTVFLILDFEIIEGIKNYRVKIK